MLCTLHADYEKAIVVVLILKRTAEKFEKLDLLLTRVLIEEGVARYITDFEKFFINEF